MSPKQRRPLMLTSRGLPTMSKHNSETKNLVLAALIEMKPQLSGRKVNVVAKQINNSYGPLAQYKSVHSIKDIENVIQQLGEDGHIYLNLSKERFAIEIPPHITPPELRFEKKRFNKYY